MLLPWTPSGIDDLVSVQTRGLCPSFHGPWEAKRPKRQRQRAQENLWDHFRKLVSSEHFLLRKEREIVAEGILNEGLIPLLWQLAISVAGPRRITWNTKPTVFSGAGKHDNSIYWLWYFGERKKRQGGGRQNTELMTNFSWTTLIQEVMIYQDDPTSNNQDHRQRRNKVITNGDGATSPSWSLVKKYGQMGVRMHRQPQSAWSFTATAASWWGEEGRRCCSLSNTNPIDINENGLGILWFL